VLQVLHLFWAPDGDTRDASSPARISAPTAF
jgi:hypothetical protein